MHPIKQLFLLPLVFALLGSASARAEWTRLGNTAKETDAYVLYIDSATIQRNGDMARMWDLQDFKQTQSSGDQAYRSEKSELEFDYKERRARVLSIIDFVGPMATGGIASSDGVASDWSPVKPRTMGEVEWSTACAGK